MLRRDGLITAIAVLLISALPSFSHGAPLPTVEAQFLRGTEPITPVLKLEVAATAQSRMIGLMYRNELQADSGMLFVYPESEFRQFWMKNTFISLDLIFLDEKFRVQGVVERAEPRSLRMLSVEGAESKMIVELIAGSAKRFGIAPGDRLSVSEKLPNAEFGP